MHKSKSSRKLLLLSVSAGAGHRRAAEAIEAWARIHSNTDAIEWNVLHLDVMDYVSATFRKIYTDFYIHLVSKAPSIWGYLYDASHQANPNGQLEKLRRAIERLNSRQLIDAVEEFNPDQIVCTHFLPAELLSRLISTKKINYPIWVQVTDFDLHRMWIQENVQGYFVANREIAWRLTQLHVEPSRIVVTGIPVVPQFSQHDLQRTETKYQHRQKAGMLVQHFTALLMAGGSGIGDLESIATDLLSHLPELQLIVLTGRNQRSLLQLQRLQPSFSGRLHAFGYTDQVAQWMACADIVISKPGGLTCAECLAMGVPMIVNSPIPGQEERNADFLMESGVALKANDLMGLRFRLQQLIGHPERVRGMRDKAIAISQPNAAHHVLAHLSHIFL